MVSCRSGQYSREIIGHIKPITANIVPYEYPWLTNIILGKCNRHMFPKNYNALVVMERFHRATWQIENIKIYYAFRNWVPFS